jgi:biotin carboxyl carrier protein
MSSDENKKDAEKPETDKQIKANDTLPFEFPEETQEIAYTENDIIKVDSADYRTNFTPKFIAKKNYKFGDKKTEIKSFLPGQIIKVFVKKKKKVKAGKTLVTFEAMKMINEIIAQEDIDIIDVLVKAGDTVEKGQTLIKYKVRPKK